MEVNSCTCRVLRGMTRSDTGMSGVRGMARMAGRVHAHCSVALQLKRGQACWAKKDCERCLVEGGTG